MANKNSKRGGAKRTRGAQGVRPLTGKIANSVDDAVDLTPVNQRLRPWVKEYHSAAFCQPTEDRSSLRGMRVRIRQWGEDGDGDAPRLYRRAIYIDADVQGMRSVIDLPNSISPISIDLAVLEIDDAEEFALALLTLIREARAEHAILRGRY